MILSIVTIVCLAALLSFNLRKDYKLSKFRNNLKPGQNVMHRFGEEYTPAVVEKYHKPNVICFHLAKNIRQQVYSSVTMIYPV